VAEAVPPATSAAHVAPDAALADDVSLAPGVVVHEGVSIGARSSVGACTVIHAGTQIGSDCLIEDGVVLGKRPRLRPGSSAGAAPGPEADALRIADGVTICAGAVVYWSARIDSEAVIGDQSQVRERSVIGARSVIGRGSTVDNDVAIGERVLIQTLVYVTAGSSVEDEVFLGPGVTTTNDHTMGRHQPGAPLCGVIFRRACRVGGGVVVAPGVEIGEEAFVAAGAVVIRDVGVREVAMGVPACVVRTVPDEDLIERFRVQ
jgi:UDP-3-O-[3-hydroxymyristoyl] glucosamine N-acyltransferase